MAKFPKETVDLYRRCSRDSAISQTVDETREENFDRCDHDSKPAVVSETKFLHQMIFNTTMIKFKLNTWCGNGSVLKIILITMTLSVAVIEMILTRADGNIVDSVDPSTS